MGVGVCVYDSTSRIRQNSMEPEVESKVEETLYGGRVKVVVVVVY